MGKTVSDRGRSAGAVARRVGVSILATVILFGSPTIVRQGAAAAARAEPESAVSSAAEVSRDIAFVQWFGDEIVVLLRQGALSNPAARERFRKLLLETVDLPTVSQSALGRYWRMATDAQRARYRAAFPDHFLATYGGLLRHYSGQTLEIDASRPVGNNERLVEGKVEGTGGPSITLAFRVRKVGDEWKLVDFYVDGISLVMTQRPGFASVIKRGGMESLLARLERATVRNASNL